jgi:hypothetical protein
MRPLLVFSNQRLTVEEAPAIVLKTLLMVGTPPKKGSPSKLSPRRWFAILELIHRGPKDLYEIGPRAWEEIVAGAYTRAGFEELILTPRIDDQDHHPECGRKRAGGMRPSASCARCSL